MLNNGFSFRKKRKRHTKVDILDLKKAYKFKLFFAERFCIYNENHQKQGWK